MKNGKNIFKFAIFFLIIVAVIAAVVFLGKEINMEVKEVTKQLTIKA